jgi:type I restriction enzyme R subunit
MNHSTDTTEKGLEAHIAQYLVEENKYLLRENKVYDNANCIDSELLFQFLEATQPKAVAKIKTYHKELYEQ